MEYEVQICKDWLEKLIARSWCGETWIDYWLVDDDNPKRIFKPRTFDRHTYMLDLWCGKEIIVEDLNSRACIGWVSDNYREFVYRKSRWFLRHLGERTSVMYRLSLDDIKHALSAMLNSESALYKQTAVRFLTTYFDDEDARRIIAVALFGESIYE